MDAKILIVDDEEPILHMLKRLLTSHGYEIYTAQSGEEALKLDTSMPLDLVITDLRMPNMDGLEMAQQMLAKNPDRPVLMMTAYADLNSARKSVHIGIYEYFIKPTEMNDFLAGVQRALRHRMLVLENQAYQRDLEQKVVERTRELTLKVQDLEARDELLRHLLSLQDPEENLRLAVKLAARLIEADFGVLFIRQEKLQVRAAFGFDGKDTLATNDVPDLGLDGGGTTLLIQKMFTHPKPCVIQEIDDVRKGFDIVSLGLVPVCKSKDVVACLEVDRKAQGAAIALDDLNRLTSFAPYIAMAISDCHLQATLPHWEKEIEDILGQVEKWED